MSFSVICDLIALAGAKSKASAVLELCMEFAIEAQQNVAFETPMVCQIARRVFDHADPDLPEILGPPVGNACLTRMMSGSDLAPVGGSEGDFVDFHCFLEVGENYG